MKKYIVAISIISIMFLGNITFSREDGCKYVKDFNGKELSQDVKNMYNTSLGKDLLTEKGLLRALRNLKKYCCFNEKVLNNCNKADYDDIGNDYPKTPYFFDHILSVMVRRLDYKNYTGVDMDEKAAEWLKFVNEYAIKPEGAIPIELTTKYKEYRLNDKSWETKTVGKLSINIPKYKISLYDATSQQSYIDYVSGHDMNKFKKMEDWDLTTKYLNVCQIAILMSQGQGEYNNDQERVVDQDLCIKKINEYLRKTAILYSEITQTQSDQLMKNTHTDYKNRGKERANNVATTLGRTNTYLFGVIRMIQQITPKCN